MRCAAPTSALVKATMTAVPIGASHRRDPGSDYLGRAAGIFAAP
jgi:hypothetical protein